MVGEEHTIVGPYVQAPFQGPEDVHLLDWRAIRSSQVVHGKRAQCELHDNGPVVPIGCRLCASVAATMPISRMLTSDRTRVQSHHSTQDRVKWRLPVYGRSMEDARARRRFRVVVVCGANSVSEATRRPRATCSRSGRVAPGCASSAEAPRRRGPGAAASCGRDNPTHGVEPCEPPAS